MPWATPFQPIIVFESAFNCLVKEITVVKIPDAKLNSSPVYANANANSNICLVNINLNVEPAMQQKRH